MQLTEIRERASESRAEVGAKRERLQEALLELGRSMVEGGNSAHATTIIAGLRADIQKAEDVATALDLIAAEATLESEVSRSIPETLEVLKAERDSVTEQIGQLEVELEKLSWPPFTQDNFVRDKAVRGEMQSLRTRLLSVSASIQGYK